MDIIDLQCFIELAATHHFTRAADNLNMSESSLSKKIRRLEEELGAVELFVRSTRNVSLTSAGATFLDYAKRIVGAYEEAESVLSNFHATKPKVINLGITASSRIEDLSRVISAYCKNYAGVKFKITESYTNDLINLFNQKKLDMIFIVDTNSNSFNNARIFPLFTEELYFVAGKDHPLAAEAQLRLSDLKDEKFVMYSWSSAMRKLFMDTCISEGITPQIVHECNSYKGILRLVKENCGVTLMIKYLVDQENRDGSLVSIPLVPGLRRQYSLIVNSSSMHRKIIADFVNDVLEKLSSKITY